MSLVLGIESSCDDTGLALYDTKKGLLSHGLATQLQTHQPYGGVVPELAARDHIRHIAPLLDKVLDQAQLKVSAIDAIAYTKGPGLLGSLMVGAGFAQGLGLDLGVPVLGVHHLEAHILAPFLEKKAPSYPFLAVLVSGGHTQLIAVEAFGKYQIIGETRDDAVGEAFDKTAKLLGLPYPGGPALAKLALNGKEGAFTFSKPMLHKGLEMSFSGLKTQVYNQVLQLGTLGAQQKADIAYAFEQTITDTLVHKTKKALEQTSFKQVVLSGGVSANICLREKMAALQDTMGIEAFYPSLEFCTDNGAMVAQLGALRLDDKKSLVEDSLAVLPRWPLHTL